MPGTHRTGRDRGSVLSIPHILTHNSAIILILGAGFKLLAEHDPIPAVDLAAERADEIVVMLAELGQVEQE